MVSILARLLGALGRRKEESGVKGFRYVGGTIVSCAVCGKYPDYDERVLLVSKEGFEEAKRQSCPPHRLVEAPEPDWCGLRYLKHILSAEGDRSYSDSEYVFMIRELVSGALPRGGQDERF